jgi:hypothetical protein
VAHCMNYSNPFFTLSILHFHQMEYPFFDIQREAIQYCRGSISKRFFSTASETTTKYTAMTRYAW